MKVKILLCNPNAIIDGSFWYPVEFNETDFPNLFDTLQDSFFKLQNAGYNIVVTSIEM